MWRRLENYRCSAVLVAVCWGRPIYLGGKQCVTWSGTTTAHRSSTPESKMDICTMPLSGMTCEALTVGRGADTSTSSPRDSRVSLSVSREQWEQGSTSETAGQTRGALFAMLDHDGFTWRTCQVSLLGPTDISGQFSESWPRSGMMRGGVCYLLPPLVPHIAVIESGLGAGYATPTATANQLAPSMQRHPSCHAWLPTPKASDGTRGDCESERSRRSPSLVSVAKMLPTPTARDGKDCGAPSEYRRNTPPLATHAGGQLNPTWVEWLMGWPIGWTDLEPLETARFQEWLQKHGNF